MDTEKLESTIMALRSPEQIFDCGQCPFCGSTQIKVIKTRRPIRKMHCRGCGNEWSAVLVHLAYQGALSDAAELMNLAPKLGHIFP